MSNPVRPHRQQPTRLPRPWDSPGKNTGVGCHCLLQCMRVKSESEVAPSCPTLSDPTDCSPPGSSIHGIFQARVLEWGAVAFSVTNQGKCKSKPQWVITSHLSEWLASKSLQIINYGEGLERRKLFYSIGENVETVWFLKKLKLDLLYDPAVPLLGV